jgi:hypothetical protein
MEKRLPYLRLLSITFVLITLLIVPLGISPGYSAPIQVGQLEKPTDDEYPIAYEDIYPKLKEIAKNSNRVKVEVIGQSAGDRDMFLVTLSDPKAMGRLGHYQRIRKLMLEDPEAAQELIVELGDFKVPFFVNASIHGDEKPGVDAAIRLIETLAYEDNDEVRAILDSVILLVNVVANPDGRVQNTRSNANGFDLNRDFITQSQPETRAMVKVITEWNPMVLLDLHGFYNPMLIEPCTPLHNPNYEYDLYIQWAYQEALAMEAELDAQTGYSAQIPFRDDASGWDDWPPTYTPMYAMYHGAYGHTLETPYRDHRGVDAHYAAVWGALKFVSENRQGMIYDQIEIFRRGFLDLDQNPISVDWLEENDIPHDQYNEWVVKEFPTAYILPKGSPGQINDHQVARIVDFLLENDVKVEKALQEFTYDDVTYPVGTYIVWMDQPKRGLANTILERGPDMSEIEGISFYSPPSVWSNLLLWGGQEIVVEDELLIDTVGIKQADPPQGFVEAGPANAYAYLTTNLNAFRAANDLLNSGETVFRLTQSVTSGERTFTPGTLILPADPELADDLADTYALEIYALQSFPPEVDVLSEQKIAVVADVDTEYALGRLGFDYDSLSQGDLNSDSIDEYDVLINQSVSWSNLGKPGRASIEDFILGGGDYIGLGTTGTSFAVDAGILDVTYASNSGNAIVEVAFTENDSIAAGFHEQDYAFVYSPVWFTELGEGVVTSASLVEGDFLVSGYWPSWGSSGAAGMPVVVHAPTSGTGTATLIGLDITFRGHPENTFRLLGNAIFE